MVDADFDPYQDSEGQFAWGREPDEEEEVADLALHDFNYYSQ
jgi:hypothetical protein